MEYIRIDCNRKDELRLLQLAYKQDIGEEEPTEADFNSLWKAIEEENILFYGCLREGKLIACCSVSPVYSTFNYQKGGVFEDFYISPEYRHQGIARQLVRFACRESQVGSLTAGCADCDVEMYQSLGFRIPIGNLYAFDLQGNK